MGLVTGGLDTITFALDTLESPELVLTFCWILFKWFDGEDVICTDWDDDILICEKLDGEDVTFEYWEGEDVTCDNFDGEDLIGTYCEGENGTWANWGGEGVPCTNRDGEDVVCANWDGEDVTFEKLDGEDATWDGEEVTFENCDGEDNIFENWDGDGITLEHWDGDGDVACKNPDCVEVTCVSWCEEDIGWKELETCGEDVDSGLLWADLTGWITDRGETLLRDWLDTSGIVLE